MMTVEIFQFDELPWGKLGDHREYQLRIKTLLCGREGALDNFRLVFSEGTGGVQRGPRHRHTFEQIRMPLNKRTSYGTRRFIEPGEIGYFPEGLHYGPTEDEMDVGGAAITLQFGGASGLGFLSGAQTARATQALEKFGTFEKGLFRWRESGPIRRRKVQDAYEALWEHVNGCPIEYPVPRYRDQIIMRPANFKWQARPDEPGVMGKSLGDFTECHVSVALMRVEAESVASLGPSPGTQVGFVLSGSGMVDGKPVSTHAAIRVDAGAHVRIESRAGLELVVFGLPVFPAPDGSDAAFAGRTTATATRRLEIAGA